MCCDLKICALEINNGSDLLLSNIILFCSFIYYFVIISGQYSLYLYYCLYKIMYFCLEQDNKSSAWVRLWCQWLPPRLCCCACVSAGESLEKAKIKKCSAGENKVAKLKTEPCLLWARSWWAPLVWKNMCSFIQNMPPRLYNFSTHAGLLSFYLAHPLVYFGSCPDTWLLLVTLRGSLWWSLPALACGQ